MFEIDLQWAKAKHSFERAEEGLLQEADRVIRRSMWGQFWTAHQRYFKYVCIAAKVSHAVKVAKEAIADGNCAVIGLQSTGEARTLDVLAQEDGELTDFVSTAK